jgi:RHH-type rel operon transcriptional repressor/antitoxin RelB
MSRALQSLADATDRPRSYLIRKAIEEYLGEQADARIALERLQDRSDPVVSGAAIRKALGL